MHDKLQVTTNLNFTFKFKDLIGQEVSSFPPLVRTPFPTGSCTLTEKDIEERLRQILQKSCPYSRDVMALQLLLVDGVLDYHDLLPTAEVGAALPPPPIGRRQEQIQSKEGVYPNAQPAHRRCILSPVLSPRPPFPPLK